MHWQCVDGDDQENLEKYILEKKKSSRSEMFRNFKECLLGGSMAVAAYAANIAARGDFRRSTFLACGADESQETKEESLSGTRHQRYVSYGGEQLLLIGAGLRCVPPKQCDLMLRCVCVA